MAEKKFTYEYLLTDEAQDSVIRPFIDMVYGEKTYSKTKDSKEATAKFLEHHRTFDIGNEFTLFRDLSQIRGCHCLSCTSWSPHTMRDLTTNCTSIKTRSNS